jgi:ankyrin repeat protein
VVKLLLAREGVDPNSKGVGSLTPLLLAARLGHKEMVNLLLTKNGVDPDPKDDNGRTALSFTAQEGHACQIFRVHLTPVVVV